MILAETVQNLGIAIPTVQSRIMTQVITNKLTMYRLPRNGLKGGYSGLVTWAAINCEVSSYNTPNSCCQWPHSRNLIGCMTGKNTQHRVTVATWSLSGITQPLPPHCGAQSTVTMWYIQLAVRTCNTGETWIVMQLVWGSSMPASCPQASWTAITNCINYTNSLLWLVSTGVEPTYQRNMVHWFSC